jgi:PLD-like domain
VQRGDGTMGEVADFAYLKSKVPYPFSLEFDPGPGIHVHDKFIIVDFNGENPAVFTGSSNLAEGGEQANGDSLIMIEDRVFATVYAIEALKIFDHYSFRDKMKTATQAAPLGLWYPGKPGDPWWTPAYDEKDIKFRDRCLFANIALPPTLQSHKDADWSSIADTAGADAGTTGDGGTTSHGATPATPAKPTSPAAPAPAPGKPSRPAQKPTKPPAAKPPAAQPAAPAAAPATPAAAPSGRRKPSAAKPPRGGTKRKPVKAQKPAAPPKAKAKRKTAQKSAAKRKTAARKAAPTPAKRAAKRPAKSAGRGAKSPATKTAAKRGAKSAARRPVGRPRGKSTSRRGR